MTVTYSDITKMLNFESDVNAMNLYLTGCCGSENSEDITDNYIKDILKNKHMLEDICAYSGSTDISSRCTQYEKLTKQVDFIYFLLKLVHSDAFGHA